MLARRVWDWRRGVPGLLTTTQSVPLAQFTQIVVFSARRLFATRKSTTSDVDGITTAAANAATANATSADPIPVADLDAAPLVRPTTVDDPTLNADPQVDDGPDDMYSDENLKREIASWATIPPAHDSLPRKYARSVSATAGRDLTYEGSPLIEYFKKLGVKEDNLRKGFLGERGSRLPRKYLAWSSDEVEKLFSPRIQFLRSLGLSDADLSKIGDRFIQTFLLDVERNMKPSVKFLVERLGIPPKQVSRIIVKYPNVLYHPVQNGMDQRVFFLTELNIPSSEIGKIVRKFPQILGINVELHLKERLRQLSDLLGIKDFGRIIMKHPPLLSYSENLVRAKVELFKSWGLSSDDITRIVTLFPQIVVLDAERNLIPKFEFFTKLLGYSVKTIVYFPIVFSYSLINRTEPRIFFMNEQVRLKRLDTLPSVWVALYLKDEAYAKRMRATIDEYNEFKTQYLAERKRLGAIPDVTTLHGSRIVDATIVPDVGDLSPKKE